MTEFQPGFRLSKFDIAVVILGAITAMYFYKISLLFSLIIAFVVTHFFLFCNITRMSRPPELIWAFSFSCLSVASIEFELFPIYQFFIASICVTVVLVCLEIKKPNYHGILWKRVNPNLKVWFSENAQKRMQQALDD